MQISFEALERALAPIEEIGQGELTFPIGTVNITLRVLTPEQEVDVQRYASEAVQDKDESVSNTADYLERFKIAILSHAITQVGDQDLRDVDLVETGEKLPNGVSVKLPKVQALRKVLLKWTGTIRTNVFRKYGELIERVERKAEIAIQFDPADLDAEIERVEGRLAALKEDREKAQKAEPSPVNKMVKALARSDQAEQSEFREQLDQFSASRAGVELAPEPQPEETAPVAPQAPQERRSILPTAAPPPGALRPTTAPQPVPPVVVPPPKQQPPAPYPPDGDDSFYDPADTDGMEAAVAAENRRLLAMRQQALAQAQAQAAQQAAQAMPGRIARPPHLDAAAAAGLDIDNLDPTQLLPQSQMVNGVETFRLPTEEMQSRSGPPAGGRVPINQGSAGGKAVNPRFQPPRRGP